MPYDFDRDSNIPVFYMAHPVATDDFYDYDQNMDHILEMMRFFYEDCKVRVIAPYHTLLMFMDNKNEKHVKTGLEVDCAVVKRLHNLILVGHKISSGMKDEQLAAAEASATIWNFVGLSRRGIRESKEIRDYTAAITVAQHRKEVGREEPKYNELEPKRERPIYIGNAVR